MVRRFWVLLLALAVLGCKQGEISGSVGSDTSEENLSPAENASSLFIQVISSSSVRLSWQASSTANADYYIAMSESASSPADCSNAQYGPFSGNSADISVTPASASVKDFSFRLCAKSSSTSLSSGVTSSIELPPDNCDHTFTLAGSPYSFTDVEGFMGTDLDANSISKLCFEDGVNVANTGAESWISVPTTTGLHHILFADESATVSFSNTRGTGTTSDDSILYFNSSGDASITFSVYNINMSTTGKNGKGIEVSGTDSNASVFSNLQINTSGQTAYGIDVRSNGYIEEISNTTIATSGNSSEAFRVTGSGCVINKLINSSSNTTNGTAMGIEIIDGSINEIDGFVHDGTGGSTSGRGLYIDRGSVGSLKNSTFNMANSTGIEITGTSDAFISEIDNVTIVKNQTSAANIIAFEFGLDSGGDHYVDSANIKNLRICSHPLAATKWEDYASCTGTAGMCGLISDRTGGNDVAPTAYTPYAGNPTITQGASTIPFDDGLGMVVVGTQSGVDGIHLGGECP